jgi:hypothetical protein
LQVPSSSRSASGGGSALVQLGKLALRDEIDRADPLAILGESVDAEDSDAPAAKLAASNRARSGQWAGGHSKLSPAIRPISMRRLS